MDTVKVGRHIEAVVLLNSNGQLGTSDNVSVPTGVSIPGGVFLFLSGKNSDQNALVCGLDGDGNGVVEHWKRIRPGNYRKQNQTMRMPSGRHDFLGVAYIQEAGKIYLLDGASKAIYENSWNGVDQVPPKNWIPWATCDMVPELLDAEYYQLNVEGRLTPPRVVLSAELVTLDYPFATPVYMHWDAGFHAERFLRQMTRTVGFGPFSLSEGKSTVVARGASSSGVEIVDCRDGAIVGAGIIPSDADHVSIDLSRSPVVGGRYLAREKGIPTDPNLFGVLCPVRYGYSETLSSGVSMSGMHYPMGCRVGSTSMFYLSTSKNIGQGIDSTFEGFMAIALRGQNGQDPVVQVGDNWLLDTIYYVDVTGYVGSPNGLLAGHLPIPGDPALTGAVLLAQFWTIDGQAIRLSQILGAKIEAQAMPGSPAGGSGRASTFPLDRKFNVQAGGEAIVAQILARRAQ